MLRQVTEPVWGVTASSSKFSHLVKSNTRLKKNTWLTKANQYPPTSASLDLWSLECDGLRLLLYTPT